jgi:hypothetical protein
MFAFYAYDFVDISEACNKNILLWRIFEHKNPIHWAELDLKNVYTFEVQPHGYTFPFELIIRSLHYERFVQNILGELGSRTFAFNRNKVTNYVKKIQPLAPPPASPKKNKREKSGFCCCRLLLNIPSGQNLVTILLLLFCSEQEQRGGCHEIPE